MRRRKGRVEGQRGRYTGRPDPTLVDRERADFVEDHRRSPRQALKKPLTRSLVSGQHVHVQAPAELATQATRVDSVCQQRT